MNVYVYSGKYFYVCSDHPVNGNRLAWTAFSVEHVAHNFATWLEAFTDTRRLLERIAFNQCTQEDHTLVEMIQRRMIHESYVYTDNPCLYTEQRE